MKNIIYTIALIGILFTACTKEKNEVISIENGKEEIITLTDEQKKLATIQTGKIQEIEMGREISCSGMITIYPDGMAKIASPIEGNIKSFKVKMSQKVFKNQILATIQHQNIIAIQENFLKAKVNFELQKSLYERNSKLYEENASSDKQKEMAKKEYSEAKIIFESLKRQLELIGILPSKLNENNISASINIKSPINGYVIKIIPAIGEFVNADQSLFEIVDESKKCVELDIFSNSRSLISEGQPVKIKALGTKESFESKIKFINRSINKETQTISAITNIPQNEAYIPIGTTINAIISVENQKVFAIENEAIIDIEGSNYVFIEEGNSYKEYQINTGIKNSKYTQIINYENIVNKNIVISGAYYLIE